MAKKERTPYWFRAIAKAEKRGYFTDEEKDKAQHWQTCACGKQDRKIPRKEIDGVRGDAPEDGVLYDLGMEFADAVSSDDTGAAPTILRQIEKRAGEILASLRR